MAKTCKECGATSPAENRYCGQCGQQLRYHEVLAASDPDAIDRLLGDIDVRQVGKAVALSVGALAAEAVVLYLRRRLRQQDDDPDLSNAKRVRNAGLGLLTGVAILVSERQLVEKQDGRPLRRFMDRSVRRRDAK